MCHDSFIGQERIGKNEEHYQRAPNRVRESSPNGILAGSLVGEPYHISWLPYKHAGHDEQRKVVTSSMRYRTYRREALATRVGEPRACGSIRYSNRFLWLKSAGRMASFSLAQSSTPLSRRSYECSLALGGGSCSKPPRRDWHCPLGTCGRYLRDLRHSRAMSKPASTLIRVEHYSHSSAIFSVRFWNTSAAPSMRVFTIHLRNSRTLMVFGKT